MFLFAINEWTAIAEEKRIVRESKIYQDLIIPKTEDSYRTVPEKLLSSFYWTSMLSTNSKLKWIVKLDDDVLLNVQRLDLFLKNIISDAIYCKVISNMKPFRDPNNKWYDNLGKISENIFFACLIEIHQVLNLQVHFKNGI